MWDSAGTGTSLIELLVDNKLVYKYLARQFTFKDLLDFILKNKNGKVFLGFSDAQIVYAIKEGIDNGTLLYSVSSSGNLDGMILAKENKVNKILFITENLAISMNNLKQFAKIATERWPGYKLEFFKHSNHKIQDLDKLYKKLPQ